MDELHNVAAFAVAVSTKGLALLTGGIIAALIIVIEKWRRQPIRWETFVAIVVIILLPAAYLTWRDEYVKNIGKVELQFYFASDIAGSDIRVEFIAINTTPAYLAVIRRIDLIRVGAADKSDFMRYPTATKCNAVWASPDDNARFENITKQKATKYELKDGAFSYLKSDSQYVPITIYPGKTIILNLNFTGESVDTTKLNILSICPAIVYLQNDGSTASVVCQGDTREIPWKNKGGIRGGSDILRFVIFPKLDLSHCRSVSS
jgi:hypothetical protein